MIGRWSSQKNKIHRTCHDQGLFFTVKSNNLPNEDDNFDTLADAFMAWLVTSVFDSLDYFVAN